MICAGRARRSNCSVSGWQPLRGGSSRTVVARAVKRDKQRREQFLRGPGNKLAVSACASRGVPTRRLDRQTVQFHADKGLHQVRQFNAEEADAAINIQQMPRSAVSQAVPHDLHQSGQQEEVVLEERIRRHFPALGGNAQDHLDSALGRRMGADILDLLVEGWLGNLAFLEIHHQPAVARMKPMFSPCLNLSHWLRIMMRFR